MVKSTLALQQPVLEAIEKLESKMDAKFEKLESRWDARFEKMETNFADLRVATAKRDTWLIIAVISLAATVAGFLFRIQSLTAL